MESPVVLAWDAQFFGDDEYRIQIRDARTHVAKYDPGEFKQDSFDTSHPVYVKSELYRVVFKCGLDKKRKERGKECEGEFTFALVSCGCPASHPTLVQECVATSPYIDRSKSALCRDDRTSESEITGEWTTTGASGPATSFTVFYGTTTTRSTTATQEQARSITREIEAGISFKRGPSVSIQLSETVSSSISSTTSSSITVKEGTSVTAACPHWSESGTGSWFLWQWSMNQEEDARGPGFHASTNHFRCTESFSLPPRCPLGYCSDLQCQKCSSPFEEQSAPTLTPSPTSAPTGKTNLFQCRNDREWFVVSNNGATRGCSWVRKKASRCNRRGNDGRRGYQACPKACGNDPNWATEVGPANNRRKVGCRWVKKNPNRRCRSRGTEGRRAFAACAAACCEYNSRGGGSATDVDDFFSESGTGVAPALWCGEG